MAASSSSVVPTRRKGGRTYDVFLSFRGEDTRNNFVDHLYEALVQKGIHTFKDDKMLGRGQPISQELLKAIKESRWAVVVFSKHYANSSWCLEELSNIMECHKQMGGQKVLPVFYHVDPSDVRKQNGDFKTAFETHEDKFKGGEMDKVNKWREALTAAASLSGQHISPDHGGEASFINKIVQQISSDIQPRAFKRHKDRFRGEVDKVKKWRDALTEADDLRGYDINSSYDNVVESVSITDIVERILADIKPHGNSRLDVNTEKIRSGFQHVETSGRQIGKLLVSDKEIGRGSNGTSVLEGTYDTRPVAVKRVLKSHRNVASKEIKNLIHSDHHPNIVRYYGVEYDQDFVYIALERCICSLQELILPPTNPTDQFQQLTSEFESFKLPNGHPSPELLKVMRDTVTGLAHLHKLGFIHRDLKPQNVLICKHSSISAKVSDMGISKLLPADKSSLTSATGYGSPGWQAPELFHEEPQITLAVDLFSLGCLLFFCITGGRHPFGDDVHELDINIKNDRKDYLFLVDNIPEVFDLVSKLIDREPKSRPSAAEVYHHPLFWDPETRLSFFRDASDFVEAEYRLPNSVLRIPLESIGTVVFGSKWDDKLDSTLLNDLKTGRRKYTYTSMSDLLRVIRNKFNHYGDLPEAVQKVFGNVPTGFEAYFRSQFPKLLIEVYKVLKQHCENEERLKKYFKKSLDMIEHK